MDVANWSTATETNVGQWSCSSYATNQLWQLNPKGLGWYEVRSVRTANSSSPQCLDIKNTSSANGANIQVFNCGWFGYGAQQWMISIPNG